MRIRSIGRSCAATCVVASASLIASPALASVDVSFDSGTIGVNGQASAAGVTDSATATFPVAASGASGGGSTGTGLVEWSALASGSAAADLTFLTPDLVLFSVALSVELEGDCDDYDIPGCCSMDATASGGRSEKISAQAWSAWLRRRMSAPAAEARKR